MSSNQRHKLHGREFMSWARKSVISQHSTLSCMLGLGHKQDHTCAISRTMARKAYKPRQTRLLRAAPTRPVAAVMNVNSPAPKKA